jgi:acyl-CoA thioesterase FadM
LGLPPEETFKNVKEGFGLPIVEAWGRFRRPRRYGDLLDIETRIQEMRPKAVVFRFESYPETGRDLLIEGTATLPIGPEWRARDLPERIKSLVSGTMKPGFKQTS